MFESDDFDQILSQLDYSDSITETTSPCKDRAINVPAPTGIAEEFTKPLAPCENKLIQNIEKSKSTLECSHRTIVIPKELEDYDSIVINKDFEKITQNVRETNESLKANKRRMLDSLFNHRSKRKFPGPAGLLTGPRAPTHSDDSSIEIFSQDVDFSQDRLHPEVFESELWQRMQSDLRVWGTLCVDSISCVTQAEPSGRRPSHKAQTIIAFVETIDRSALDPMIVLRDSSGTIKCTLHRDAWSAFAPYIISEYTAMAIWKPTVLTTGTAFKKHYLTITLSNIIAIYGSKCINHLQEKIQEMPTGYSKISEGDLTIIKMLSCPQNDNDSSNYTIKIQDNSSCCMNEDPLEGVDSLSFLDDIF